MARNERQRAQIRAQNAARNAAVRRLIEAHGEEYRRLYREECERTGTTPGPDTGRVTKRKRAKPLVDEILASGVLDGVEIPTKPTPTYEVPDHPWVNAQRMTRTEQLEAKAAGVPMIDKPDPQIVIPPPFWEE